MEATVVYWGYIGILSNIFSVDIYVYPSTFPQISTNILGVLGCSSLDHVCNCLWEIAAVACSTCETCEL